MTTMIISAKTEKDFLFVFENKLHNLEKQTDTDFFNYKKLPNCIASIIYNINEEDRQTIVNKCIAYNSFIKFYQWKNKDFNLIQSLKQLNQDWYEPNIYFDDSE